MHSLVVVLFNGAEQAETFRLDNRYGPVAELIDCAKVVEAVCDAKGQVHLQYRHTLAKDGAFIGGVWGALVGLLFLNPLMGIVAGAGIGAATGELGNIGIGSDFQNRLAQHLKPNTSALFIPVQNASADLLEKRLQSSGGHVLKTRLLPEDEKAMEAALEKITSAATAV
ncbi:MAG: DUF1269 domain-containing protein [Bilophila sp.]